MTESSNDLPVAYGASNHHPKEKKNLCYSKFVMKWKRQRPLIIHEAASLQTCSDIILFDWVWDCIMWHYVQEKIMKGCFNKSSFLFFFLFGRVKGDF